MRHIYIFRVTSNTRGSGSQNVAGIGTLQASNHTLLCYAEADLLYNSRSCNFDEHLRVHLGRTRKLPLRRRMRTTVTASAVVDLVWFREAMNGWAWPRHGVRSPSETGVSPRGLYGMTDEPLLQLLCYCAQHSVPGLARFSVSWVPKTALFSHW